MFAAVKELKRMKPKKQLLVRDENGNLTADPKLQTSIVQKHFQSQFYQGKPVTPAIQPTAMKQPFTANEIQTAKAKLRNN